MIGTPTLLEEERGRLKPLLARLHRQLNVSAAELDLQDKWQETVVACGVVGNDTALYSFINIAFRC